MQVYLVGGGIESDGSLLSSVEKYSVGDSTWTAANKVLPSPRSNLAGISLNNEVFFIGTNKKEQSIIFFRWNGISSFDWVYESEWEYD